MIALEIQGLSERRENLLMEIGRTVIASGFTLQRQRLAQDHHGVLLTMVVRGPERKQRALSDALGAHDRLISFVISDFDEAVQKPHFAASIKPDPKTVAPPKAAPIAPPLVAKAVVAAAEQAPVSPEPVIEQGRMTEPEPEIEPQADAIVTPVPAQAPAPAPARALVPELTDQFVELIPIGPDESAVDKLLPKLAGDYPAIFPRLQTFQASVVKAARESSLLLAGQRMGAWAFERDYAVGTKLNLQDAVESVGFPALRALVEVEQRGEQLHILNSPICVEGGDSSCQFFSGYLEGLLRPAMASDAVSIFSVCCRSYGAGECVFALSDG